MSTIAQLDVESVSVEAGGRVTLPLSVRNTGDVVEDYEIEILGIPAAWTTVDPPTFTLYPGTAQDGNRRRAPSAHLGGARRRDASGGARRSDGAP